jgi:hypothetical protein
MWHSCVRVSVLDHLRGRPREVVAIYRELGKVVRSFGPGVRTMSSKTRTGWMARVRFAGVQFRKDHVVLSFWLKREIGSPRLRPAHYGRDDWVYSLRVRSPAEIDEELRGWLREAYRVGRQEWTPEVAAASGSGPGRVPSGEGAAGGPPLRSTERGRS